MCVCVCVYSKRDQWDVCLLSSPVYKCLSLSKQRQLSPATFNKPPTKSRVIKSLILVNEHINSRGSV